MGLGAAAGAAIGGVVSAGASLIGSGEQASATTSAQNEADQTQLQEQANAQKVEAPYTNAGTQTLNNQLSLLGLNGTDAANKAFSNFTASPGYGYQVQQGLSAIDNGAASTGSLRSGNTIRAEEALGSNLANQDFSNYYNRLAGITQVGQAAASGQASAAIQTGQGIAQTDASAGNQLAGIYGNEASGVGSAINNTVNSLTSLGSSGFGSPGTVTTLPSVSIPQQSTTEYNTLSPTF